MTCIQSGIPTTPWVQAFAGGFVVLLPSSRLRTRFGQYRYRVMPFGLCNGTSTLQRYINRVLFPFLDRQVLQKLREAGLQVDIRKSEFDVTTTKFLDNINSTDGIAVDPEKVSAVRNWEPPTRVKQLQAFLGFAIFYRQFIEGFNRVAKPLHRLTAALIWEWTSEHDAAFEELKRLPSTAPVLTHFQEDRATKLETDSSDGVVSGTIPQANQQGDYHPVAFLSKTMSPAECNYMIHDKELLTILRLLQEWEQLLVSCHERFDIYTDHQALQCFATKRQLNAWQAGWNEFLSVRRRR